MEKEITIQDCLNLKQKFDDYCETAEQHEFAKLFLINTKMNATIERIQKVGRIEDQKDIRAMFRVVLKTIGEDISEYADIQT